MSHYQVQQIKVILLIIVVLLAVFYFTQFRHNPLPKEVSKVQKEWYKHFESEFKDIHSQADFYQWASKEKFKNENLNGENDEFKTTIDVLRIKNEPCVWNYMLSVNFGIQIRDGKKQYVDKIIRHETKAIKNCPK